MESEIAELDRKARSETRDRQAPLIGLVIMHRVREDPKRLLHVAQLLDELLTTAEDRAVFGLESLTREVRKQRPGLKKDDVAPFTAEELREALSASQRRSPPTRSKRWERFASRPGAVIATGMQRPRDPL